MAVYAVARGSQHSLEPAGPPHKTMKTIYEAIGENLKRKRISMLISEKDMAAVINVPVATYKKIEKGTHQISAYQLKQLAKKLSTNIDSLIHFQMR